MPDYTITVVFTRSTEEDADYFTQDQQASAKAQLQKELQEAADLGYIAGRFTVLKCSLPSTFDAQYPALAAYRAACATPCDQVLGELLEYLQSEHGFVPPKSYERLLLEFFEIDPQQLEQDRRRFYGSAHE